MIISVFGFDMVFEYFKILKWAAVFDSWAGAFVCIHFFANICKITKRLFGILMDDCVLLQMD